ncbi:universal stress protein E [Bisgaardia hudsonensis]|uniref:Universal stress protein E n=1 Tax=Bisgaardia hudsonensis TaxID=109472 RepID=A0A4R2N1A2_9PAST|nr:universal stress protein UspE [Bisgaardia hudsonensis]QLB13111.1 universal stress protein UspE [Bisgaardia hudsonensis]TCP13319.1 universal stress protein E [Bisgaardia hudsonensis]
MQFNNILVILNPETEKQYALARAVRLVKEQKSTKKVKITTLMSIYNFSYEMSALLSSEERENMHQQLIQQQQRNIAPYLEKYMDPHIEFDSTVLWTNNESDAIKDELENKNYDLVVKYTQEQETFTSLLFTPQDWQLLRKSSIPTMMVRDGDWKHQRRILIAVDVSDQENDDNSFNEQLVSFGLDLADNLERGNVHLVAAYPPTPINLTIDFPNYSSTEYDNNIRGQYLLNMKELRQKFLIDEDHTHVIEGFPEDVIPKIAKQISAETVVLGTIGRQGLSAALLGNTAEHVISKLECNLLAIKPNIPE